jgi:23S rRNA (guanine745-N1)-methyltransferase
MTRWVWFASLQYTVSLNDGCLYDQEEDACTCCSGSYSQCGHVPMAWETVLPCLICPHCRTRLTRVGTSLRCRNRHTFAIAREGYVNLRRAGRRSSPLLGDSRAMLLARRRFLAGGYYRPLVDALATTATRHLGALACDGRAAAWQVLDAGCGEGYYLGHLHRRLSAAFPARDIAYLGLDVAKDAVRLAARRYPVGQFVVADVRDRLPYADASIHVLCNVFAPRHAAEFARILASGGLLLVVIPTPRHLQQLRQAMPLLGIQPDKRQRVLEHLRHDFVLAGRATIDIELRLDNTAVRDLIQMTPSARHLTPALLSPVAMLDAVDVTASIELLQFHRRSPRRTRTRR